jgi:hypothetical protein
MIVISVADPDPGFNEDPISYLVGLIDINTEEITFV